jgi:biotin carboxyl carrier protein
MGTVILRDDSGAEHTVDVRGDAAVVDGQTIPVRQSGDGSVRVGAREVVAWVAADGDTRWTFVDGEVFTFTTGSSGRHPRRRSGLHESLSAPMPATVVKVSVRPGDPVRSGDVVVVLEAMKMELPVRSPGAGHVASVHCRAGDLVQPGVTLVEIQE